MAAAFTAFLAAFHRSVIWFQVPFAALSLSALSVIIPLPIAFAFRTRRLRQDSDQGDCPLPGLEVHGVME